MNLMIENLLKEVLEEGHITQEDFLKAAERGITDKKYKKYFNQIINFGDYTFFKSVMTKRNYQIIQMAEKEMKNEKENQNIEKKPQLPPELIAEMLANEQSEINEAIKQSLAEEDEKRRIAIIEEEEIKRAIKQSLEQAKKERKKEEKLKDEPKEENPKNVEPKKEKLKKEEHKKEEFKKFIPKISNVTNFQYSGEEKSKENKPNSIIVSSNQVMQLEESSKPEEFNLKNDLKNEIPESPNSTKTQIEAKKPEIIEKSEVQNLIKKPDNMIPKKEESITRDFVNIFEEKKMTLAPLIHKTSNPIIKSSLKEDLKKNQKANIQKDIERMQKRAEEKTETAKDIIKSSLMQNTNNKNDINYIEDDGGLLIDEDEDEQNIPVFKTDKRDNSKNNNIHFGRIAIPQNFNDKIPDYNKEKQEQLKEYREKVLKIKKDEREQKLNYQ